MIKAFLLLIILNLPVLADSLFLGPSFYYTKGEYSDGNKSRSLAFFNLVQVNKRMTLLMHYDNLAISNTGWRFNQQAFAGGIVADYFPFYFKLNYGHYMGEYKDDASTSFHSYNYNDLTNVYNADFFYFNEWNYIGAAYTYVNASGSVTEGIEGLQNHQLSLRFDSFVSPKFFFSVKPLFTYNDGELLLSSALRINYYPSDKFIIKFGGFAGERSYYFDPDLILFHNQNGIQNYQIFGQLEFIVSKNLAIIGAYNHTGFNYQVQENGSRRFGQLNNESKNFEINYFVVGFRSGFWY